MNEQSKIMSKQELAMPTLKKSEWNLRIHGLKEIESLKFRLKGLYNDLQICISSNSQEIDSLKMTEFQFKTLLKDLNDDEKIELKKNFNHEEEINNAILEERIENLKKIKIDYFSKKSNELDYTNSLGHMIEMEKINLFNQNKEKMEINDILSKIQLSYKNIDANYSVRNIKSRNMDFMENNLKKEITNLNNQVLTQGCKSEDLIQSLQRHKIQIAASKENLKQKQTILEKNIRIQKDVIKKSIHSVENMKKSKIFMEKEAVRLILGLDIIKRYILNSNINEDIVKSLKDSEEYRIFSCSRGPSNPEKKQSKQRLSVIQNFYSRSRTFSTDEQFPTKYKINTHEISNKFKNLDIEYEQLFDLYTKIINKKQFNHNLMIKYNLKQINLETKKDKYSKRVNEIIAKNYKNIDDLIKSNSKIEHFIKKFELKLFREPEEPTYIFDLKNSNKEFYKKCNNLVDEIRSFIQNISYIKLLPDKFENFFSAEDNNKLRSLSSKVTNYSLIFQNFNNKSKDQYISQILREIDLNPIFDDDSLNNQEISSFSHPSNLNQFKEFYRENKKSFHSIKIELEKLIMLTLSEYESFVEIINSIKDFTPFFINNLRCLTEVSKQDVLTPKLSKISLFPSKERKLGKNILPSPIYMPTENVEEEILIEDRNLTKVNENKNIINISRPKILNKLHKSVSEKRNYIQSLNENVNHIIKDTQKNHKENHKLIKKQNEIQKISNELILYNNPNLNINQLSNNTYNSFVKSIINNQLAIKITKTDKKTRFSVQPTKKDNDSS